MPSSTIMQFLNYRQKATLKSLPVSPAKPRELFYKFYIEPFSAVKAVYYAAGIILLASRWR